MKKNISKKDRNTIAVYDGVLYEYHNESWHEKEFQSTDDKLSNEFKSIISTSILEVRVLKDVSKES